jgi:hypothetical protein
MRKAALIVGVVCAAFAVLAAVLKSIGLPGGAILYVVFTSLFCVVALGLHLASLFRENKNGMRRVSFVLSWFGLTGLHVGLLFAALSWPGTFPVLMQGGVFSVIALVLFIVSSKKAGLVMRWVSPFTIVALVVLGSLCVGWSKAERRQQFSAEHMEHYTRETTLLDQLRGKADSTMQNFTREYSVNLGPDKVAAAKYFDRTQTLLGYIEQFETELVRNLNEAGTVNATMSLAEALKDPDDRDAVTKYMVGPSAEWPSGKGMELYDALAHYRVEHLHPDISFIIPLKYTEAHKVQWVKDNFYNVPAIDVLTRLVIIKQRIWESVNESVERKYFVH